MSEETSPPTTTTQNKLEKEDFLEVDKAIPGQNFACISFVSPEKVIASKEQFKNYVFMKSFLKDKFSMTESQWKEEYESFISEHEKKLDEDFDKENNFQTSVRGVKVRGVFDTYREAEVRAQVLQRMDRSFHVFVGQVGYWLPWDPDANQVDKQEYLENELNNLVHKYKENETQRDNYYSQQVRDRKQKAIEENEKKREEQKRSQQKRIEKKRLLQKMNNRGKEESTEETVEGSGEGEEHVKDEPKAESLFNEINEGESHLERKKNFEKSES